MLLELGFDLDTVDLDTVDLDTVDLDTVDLDTADLDTADLDAEDFAALDLVALDLVAEDFAGLEVAVGFFAADFVSTTSFFFTGAVSFFELAEPLDLESGEVLPDFEVADDSAALVDDFVVAFVSMEGFGADFVGEFCALAVLVDFFGVSTSLATFAFAGGDDVTAICVSIKLERV